MNKKEITKEHIESIQEIAQRLGCEDMLYQRISDQKETDERLEQYEEATDLDYHIWSLWECVINKDHHS